jgi:DNA replication regulator DPB11
VRYGLRLKIFWDRENLRAWLADSSVSSADPHHIPDVPQQTAKSSGSNNMLSSSSSSSLPLGRLRNTFQGQTPPPPLSKLSSITSVQPQPGSFSPQGILLETLTAGSSTSFDADKDGVPKPTWQEIEQERLTAKIPSSRTPSPMKLSRQGSRISISPVNINHEATKALQESITRALKRHTSEEDVLKEGRIAKRLRVKRPKVSFEP